MLVTHTVQIDSMKSVDFEVCSRISDAFDCEVAKINQVILELREKREKVTKAELKNETAVAELLDYSTQYICFYPCTEVSAESTIPNIAELRTLSDLVNCKPVKVHYS